MTSSSSWTRRDILTAAAVGGAAAASGIVPRRLAALTPHKGVSSLPGTIDPSIIIDETDVRSLAKRALDAAKGAGASYADVRLTRVLTQNYFGGAGVGESTFTNEGEQLGIGVRAFVNGAWGFAASPYWDPEEVVQLARNAAHQAKGNAPYGAGPAEWTSIPVTSGSWRSPVKVDPFAVPVEEKNDLLSAWLGLKTRYETPKDREYGSSYIVNFVREERAIATTDGAFFTQTLYTSDGEFNCRQEYPGQIVLPATAGGWETFTEANLPNRIPALYAEAVAQAGVTVKPGEVGRYDVVFDGAAMGGLLDRTLGVATQLDRALGYEANAGGTSFLGPDPLALLGTHQTAAPLVTVTANRTMPQGLATVKWDDEGVEPEPFTLVKDGVLVDYQTTREQAQWLAPYYQKKGMPVRSHGCAAAQDAFAITMQHTPNLVLEPGALDVTFDTLVADTQRGLAVMRGSVITDFQVRNGTGGRGNVVIREIVNGRLGAAVTNLAFMFNTQQLWKNIIVLGGAKSAVRVPGESTKGQPSQSTRHTVEAVAAKIRNVDFVDITKKV